MKKEPSVAIALESGIQGVPDECCVPVWKSDMGARKIAMQILPVLRRVVEFRTNSSHPCLHRQVEFVKYEYTLW